MLVSLIVTQSDPLLQEYHIRKRGNVLLRVNTSIPRQISPFRSQITVRINSFLTYRKRRDIMKGSHPTNRQTTQEWFASLNIWVQIVIIVGFAALVILIIINPTAGAGMTTLAGLLLMLKSLFGHDSEPPSLSQGK